MIWVRYCSKVEGIADHTAETIQGVTRLKHIVHVGFLFIAFLAGVSAPFIAEVKGEGSNAAPPSAYQSPTVQDGIPAGGPTKADVFPEQIKRQKLVETHGETVADAILAGKVLKDMTAEHVQLARGEPVRKEFVPPDAELWRYPDGEVAFSSGKVTYVDLKTPIQPVQPSENKYVPVPNKSMVADSPKPVPIPGVQVGDIYVYESIEPGNPSSSVTNKRTVTSVNGKIVMSLVNLGDENAKPRRLEFTNEWNLIGSYATDNKGQEYSPPLKYFDFPLVPGKTWTQQSKETNTKTAATKIHSVSGMVRGWESVTVPAGTFRALKIELQWEGFEPSKSEKTNGSDISWYVPEVRRSVKTMTRGSDGKERLIQLISYQVGEISRKESMDNRQASTGTVTLSGAKVRKPRSVLFDAVHRDWGTLWGEHEIALVRALGFRVDTLRLPSPQQLGSVQVSTPYKKNSAFTMQIDSSYPFMAFTANCNIAFYLRSPSGRKYESRFWPGDPYLFTGENGVWRGHLLSDISPDSRECLIRAEGLSRAPIDTETLQDYGIIWFHNAFNPIFDVEERAILRFLQDGGGVLIIGKKKNEFQPNSLVQGHGDERHYRGVTVHLFERGAGRIAWVEPSGKANPYMYRDKGNNEEYLSRETIVALFEWLAGSPWSEQPSTQNLPAQKYKGSIVSALPENVNSGGGCYYVFKSEKSIDPYKDFNKRRIFYWASGEKPVMQIYGKTISVDPIAPNNYCLPNNKYGPGCQIPSHAQPGSEFSETYQAGTVRLRFDSTITFVCDTSTYEKLAACRFVYHEYDSVLTVTDGATTESYIVQGSYGHY